MLQLPSMKYPNTQRTVSGIVDVFPDDVVLNCDTSTGAVTINLAEIPYNATSGQGFWNTQYKLYINDISNNAGTNNITVVAGTGQTLNNQPTLVLNTNGASCFIMIAGNTEYSMFYAPAQIIPPNFITVTFAQLSALISGNDLIPNSNYNVTNAEFGSTPIIPTNIFIKAITTNTVSIEGQGFFYNADYQITGNYSGVTGFTAQLGVWNQFLVTPIGTVVIWDNFHYVNKTGLNIASNPKTDIVNWQLLPYNITNGYIVDISTITYDVTTNAIVTRTDDFLNTVKRFVISGNNSLNYFKWGDSKVRENTVNRNSVLYICNATISTLVGFYSNTISNSEIIFGDGALEGGTINTWTSNNIEGSVFNFQKSAGIFTANKVDRLNLSADNVGTISGNVFNNTTLNGLINNGDIENNTFDNLRNFQITQNNGTINSNEFRNGIFEVVLLNNGSIASNFINEGRLTVSTNEINGNIQFTRILGNSLLNITTNDAEIKAVNLNNQSQLVVNNNQAGAGVYNTDISDVSRLQIGTMSKAIGIGAKSAGMIISNGSSLQIDTFSPAQPSCYANTITNGSDVIIQVFSGASFFTFNTVDTSQFYTTDLNGKNVNGNFLKGVNFGGVSPSAVFPISVIGQTAMSGNSTILLELDCADPLVYDLPTQTLTIGATLNNFGGTYRLLNAGGITIANIVGVTDAWVTEFYTNAGTTTFQGVSVVGAVPAEIVSSSGAVAFNITTYTPLTHDSIFIIKVEDLNVVRNTNILI